MIYDKYNSLFLIKNRIDTGTVNGLIKKLPLKIVHDFLLI